MATWSWILLLLALHQQSNLYVTPSVEELFTSLVNSGNKDVVVIQLQGYVDTMANDMTMTLL